jgi:hypothetical protein
MRRRAAAVALVTALVAGLTVLAAPGAAAAGKVTLLTAGLKGSREVPGPGDPDGRGRAFVRLGGGKACFVLEWSKISAPVAAHIHEGRAGVAGPVVVLFFQPGTNAASLPDTLDAVAGCVDVDRGLAARIASNPRDFYVNIHTAEFPNGAVRGHASPSAGSGSPRPSSPTSTGARSGSTARWWCCSSTSPSWTRTSPCRRPSFPPPSAPPPAASTARTRPCCARSAGSRAPST